MASVQADFTATFVALLKEAQFTFELLGSGATQIRNANYASKGIYFQSFTSLSTGLERIGKLCLMLDHFIATKGQFPDQNHMKREIGHRIELLHARTQAVVQQRGLALDFQKELKDPIELAILKVLNDFALGDRYSNIDLVVGASRAGDPVGDWFNTVDRAIFERHIGGRRKQTIADNARIIDAMMSPISHVSHISETGETIDGVEDASARTGMYKAVAPYRQLYILRIIRYWVEVLGELQHLAQQIPGENIPFFREIFAIFYNDDAMFRSRKTWLRP